MCIKLIFRSLFLQCLLPLLLGNISVFGQVKLERESRVKTAQIPAKALEFLAPVSNETKIKWFFEENLQQNSVEAKYQLKRQKYSVEFDTAGNIQDIEIIKKSKELPNPVINQIYLYLDKQFKKYTIRKIQIQFTGTPSTLQSLSAGKIDANNYTVKYEIVLKGVQRKGVKLYEFLFDQHGKFLNVAEIILENANNLEY